MSALRAVVEIDVEAVDWGRSPMLGRVNTPSPLRVALLNDYEVVVRGLQAMLEPHGDKLAVVELDVQEEVSQPVDLTLYDTFSQPQVDADLVDDVLANPNAGAVVIYSWNLHPALVEKAIAKGCRGYLDKGMSGEELAQALVRIGQGERIVSPATPEAVEQPTAGEWPGKEQGLSAREAEVVALITQGLTNNDIAERTYLSINSVKSYIRSAYRKMGVERRSQAVRWGIEHGMLPDNRMIRLDGAG